MFSVKKNVKEIIEIWSSEDSGKEKNKFKKKREREQFLLEVQRIWCLIWDGKILKKRI